MQFDLSHAPKLPSLQPSHWLRIVVYSVLAIVILWLLLWDHAKSQRISTESHQQQASYRHEVEANFTAALGKSSLSAIALTSRGMALAAKNPSLASLVLETASAKDAKYRDAALGAGFAELAVAEPLWVSDAQAAHDHTVTARRYLETAQTIDPIHAKTYELLAVAYGNLGQTDQAAEAAKKATAFAIKS